MKLVIIESPYAGDIKRHVDYGRDCLRHSFDLGEAPFASHLLYGHAQPTVLDDSVQSERERGMQAGYEWMSVAELVAFYTDLGWSPGMKKAFKIARTLQRKIETRSIYSKIGVSLDGIEITELERAGIIESFKKP